MFNNKLSKKHFKSDLYFWSFLYPNFLFLNWVLPKLILQCGDIESNPGPEINNLPNSNIKIGYVNIRSIKAWVTDPSDNSKKVCKFELLKNHVTYYNYDIFGISETWLDTSIDNSSLMIPGYLPPIRRDKTRHQGGSMIYISETIPARRREDIEPQNAEIICTEVQIKQQKVLICSCYRAPHFDIVDFCAEIKNIMDVGSCDFNSVVFIGDFNARNSVYWKEDRTTLEGRTINATFQSENYVQLIDEPTRIVPNVSSCIDLIFTNDQHIIHDFGVRDQIANCDHCPIYVTLNRQLKKNKSYKRMVWDFKHGDYDKFRSMLLQASWNRCYDNNSIDNTVGNWMSLFTTIAEECVPHYMTTIRPRDKPFMNSNLRRLMRKRDRLYKLFKSTNDVALGQQYKDLRNQIVSETRKAKEALQHKTDQLLADADTSSKKWWSTYKKVISEKQSEYNAPLMNDNKIITDNKEKADLFNEYFIGQSTLDESRANLPVGEPQCLYQIDPKNVDPVDVYSVLISLDTSKATGPDGIGNRLLKEAAVPIAEPLSQLFNFSLSVGKFPEIWKTANVIPVYKKDDAMFCNNYRPISLLPCISKVFEKILFDHIYSYLKKNNLLNKRQSGFTPGDGTINQLISICNSIYQRLDDSDEVQVFS